MKGSIRIDPAGIAIAQSMQNAAAAYSRGDFAEAERRCRQILAARRDYFDALNLLGIITAQTRRADESARLLGRAVAVKPGQATAHNNYGNVLQELKRFKDALASYERALKIRPDYAEAHVNRGNTLQDLGRAMDALDSYERALTIRPDYAEAYNNRGNALWQLKRFDEALDSFARALKIRPDYAEAYLNQGDTLRELGRPEEALESYDRALKLRPDYAEAYLNRGIPLNQLRRFDDALESYDQALKVRPDFVEALINRGITLRGLRRFDDALASYERALKIMPDCADAHNNRGNTLRELKRLEDALTSYERALKSMPDHADTHKNRANTLRELGRVEDALASFERALKLNPEVDWLYGEWLHVRMQVCDWADFDFHVGHVVGKVEQERKIAQPFFVVALTDSLAVQRQAAQIWVREHYPAAPARHPADKHRGEKIRIGYYSADFHNHATAYLMADLFETHDREKFDLVAISFGPETRDDMRGRLRAAFDQFIDVRGKTDREVAALSRELAIDIAVDLKGLTEDARTGIFSYRAAPIQVNFLGYPGTMGAPFMDYLIADQTLIPPESREYYAEKIVYLPNSYQVNDRKRRIAEREYVRAELGLPPTGFVFCCFNNSYKITPDTFDCWMRILRHVDGSVLWLLEDNKMAANALRKEAMARDVDAGRLVFARRIGLPEHLARHRVADLFLDTWPYNAHTTASDALWAGLPVVTLIGESFAARVAASLLSAVGLPELVTTTKEHYHDMAVELASNPARLAEIKGKLVTNRLTMPLFDTALFAGHLEEAFTQMYERYQADLPPEHIFVAH